MVSVVLQKKRALFGIHPGRDLRAQGDAQAAEEECRRKPVVWLCG